MVDPVAQTSEPIGLQERHRLLPEWAPCRAVLLAWPFPGSDWDDSLPAVTRCYWDLLQAVVSDASNAVQAWVLVHPTMDADAWLDEFLRRGLPQDSLALISTVPYDDTWIRDYGPLSIGQGTTCREFVDFAFNGWGGKFSADADDEVTARLAPWLQQMPVRQEWVLEGGALDVNGEGVLLANKDCVIDAKRNCSLNEQQMTRLLQEHLGVDRIEWLEGICLTGDDTDGHVDTIARFASADCVVYAGPNSQHPDHAVLESLHRQISSIAQRNGWRCMALPSPMVMSELDGRPLPATYTNFLIVNQRVLAPVYGLPEDAEAVAILQQAFPLHAVVPVQCQALVEQHGSLHCSTMQIAHHSRAEPGQEDPGLGCTE